MKEGQKLWTRNELLLAINLYCKIPFGKIHTGNPEVQKLAALIGRTPSSVSYKLVNFASLDPSLQERGIVGAKNASKLDREIWNEFYGNWETLAYQSEKLRAEAEKLPLEAMVELPESELPREGIERERLIKTRVNQSFFRKTILASYDNTCCITGISHPDFLIAGHIKPWSLDEKNMLNPRNRIAINPLHDKAFEHGYITITPDYLIKVSSKISKIMDSDNHANFFLKYNKAPIILPKRFYPDREFLEYHYEVRFIG